MRRSAIVLLSLLVLAVSPVATPAQGLLGAELPTLPGLPAVGNLFGGGEACDAEGPAPFSLAGTVAWNYQTIDLDFHTLNFAFLDIGALKHSYRFNGLQLGLKAQAVTRAGVGAIVTFDILLAGSSKDSETYNEALGGGFFFAGGRHWRTKNDTYCVDGMGFYQFSNRGALVGGFRWNHLETTFDNPDGVIAIAGLPSDEAVLVTNVYQPYVGVMLDQGGPAQVMRLGVIGWPQLYGSTKYEQTIGASFGGIGDRIHGLTGKVNEGYFWEIFGEYGLKEQKFMGAAVSVFGKWTQYHLKGIFNFEDDLIGVGNLFNDRFNITMHRNSWTAGLKVEIPLGLSVPFYF